MKKLHCDVHLGGSTKQLLEYMRRNYGQDVAAHHLAKQLLSKVKGNPQRYARRCTALMGIIYSELEGDTWLLDVLIHAMQINEKR